MYCRKECGNHYVDLCTNRCCQICCSDRECYIHHRKELSTTVSRALRAFENLKLCMWPPSQARPFKKNEPPPSIPDSTTQKSESTRVSSGPDRFNFDENYVPGCKICQTNKLEYTFGCGHCFCASCSDHFKFCPYCDQYIQSRQKIYFY